jgi:ssDNA-binding Zn-finger/Zn-ribbon topoisomerase 1
MSKESDAIIGIILGIIGGAIAAYLLGKALEPKANCPVCGTYVTKDLDNIIICPKCGTELRWN